MPGLSEIEDRASIFDKPQGRIVETQAAIAPALLNARVRDYYATVLPQFGWRPVSGDRFKRNREHLSLRYEGTGADRVVFLTITPE